MVTLSVKAGLFQFHLNSAERSALACAKIESEEKDLEWPQPRWDEARSNALAAVLLAAASLESSVNEFYQQAVDRDENALSPLSETQMELLAELCPRYGVFSRRGLEARLSSLMSFVHRMPIVLFSAMPAGEVEVE